MDDGNGRAEELLGLPGFRVLKVVTRSLRWWSWSRRPRSGHRGRKHDPLYRIRKILLTGDERLTDTGRDRLLLGQRIGDPNDEVLGAWLAKESVRDIYLASSWRDARTVLDKMIAGCAADDVAEVRSLGRTLSRWRSGYSLTTPPAHPTARLTGSTCA